MRTLNRPMFNMGGPIKEGVMHGIREPYRGGGAALVGNPVYSQTGGREHHNIWLKAGQVAGRGIKAFSNIFGKRVPVTHTPIRQVPITGTTPSSLHRGYPGSVGGGTKFVKEGPEVTKQIFEPNPFSKYIAGTPEAKILKGLYEGKGLVTKPIKWAATQSVKSPLIMGGLIWTGVSWVRKDGSPASTDEIEQNTAKHGPFDHSDKKKIKKAQAAFAEAQRDTRVKKYLDMMGYDRSKKTAVADALIDASKIVSDRGTLEKKNITRDLINPIIQATSKRFDKPEQIREAVGLMSVKAAIEKDLEDPQVKKLRALQIEKGELDLERGFETDMRTLLLSRKDKVNKETLERYARLTADKYGETFTKVEGEGDMSGDGIYMVEDTIIRVTDGVPKRIV